ncbi:MAG: putative BMP-2-inducible protein kinase, partial [Streblomastix strix]
MSLGGLMNMLQKANIAPPQETLKVGNHEVAVIKKLGEGGYSTVFHVKDQVSGQDYALKKMLAGTQESKNDCEREINIMKKFDHPNILKLIDSEGRQLSKSTYEFLLLLEYCPNTLINEMNSIATTTRLTELQIVMIFEQIVAGVVYMHTQEPPIQHRDLKVENIFHAQDGKYKIGDFGSCTIKEQNPETMTQNQIVVLEEQIQKKTTPCYRSPEMTDLYLKQKIGLPCDVWALGCILYTMCFYENPFERGGNLSIMNVAYTYPTQDEWIRSERERLKGKGPGREMYSKDILALIDFMLEPDVDSRPTILQVLSRTNEMLGKPYPRNLPQPPPPPKPTITQKHVLLFEQEERQKKSRARRQLPPELTQEDLERISQKRKSGDKRQH